MRRMAALALSVLSIAALLRADDKASTLAKEKEIELTGEARFDLCTVDPEAGRLYLAHSPNVDVIDLAKGEKIGEVSGVEGAHGIAIVPEAKRGFAASGGRGVKKLVVFDTESLKGVKDIDTDEGPDYVFYVTSAKEVWCFCGRGNSVVCVDPASLEVKAHIKLEGKPEMGVEDAAKGLVYIGFEDKSTICVVDVKKHEAGEQHSVAPGEGPTGIGFDTKNGLLFIGCGNKMMVVLSTADWKVSGTFDIGDHCDGAAFDAGTGTAYASCNGATGVVHEVDGKTCEAQASLETPGGKTCALDPKTHKLYVISGPKRGEKGPVKVLVFSAK